MTYENYRYISWSSGTPITGARLTQMSTNIQQVKDATDDKPQGIIKYKKRTSNLVVSAASAQTEQEIVALETGAPDNRINADANRFIRFNFNLTGGIKLISQGAEDLTYQLYIKQGDFGVGSPITLAVINLNPHSYSYYDVSSNSTNTTETVKSSSGPTYFGSGQYSVVIDSGASGLVNQSFFVSIKRQNNSNTANAPGYTVIAGGTSPAEFYAEDIGGIS